MADNRENTALGRFEIMCEIYLNGSEKVRATILENLDSDEERETFLTGVGFYHLFTDRNFYNTARDTLAQQLYNELH